MVETMEDGELVFEGNEVPEPLFILNCHISRNRCIISKVILVFLV